MRERCCYVVLTLTEVEVSIDSLLFDFHVTRGGKGGAGDKMYSILLSLHCLLHIKLYIIILNKIVSYQRVGKVTIAELRRRGISGEELRRLMWGRVSISTPTKAPLG